MVQLFKVPKMELIEKENLLRNIISVFQSTENFCQEVSATCSSEFIGRMWLW
jgi:hypothetical protein